MPKKESNPTPNELSTFIPLDDMGKVSEPRTMSEGTYDLVIKKATHTTSKKGKPIIQVLIEFDGEPNAATLFHTISLPTPDDDDKARDFKKLLIARFAQVFDIDCSRGLNTEDFPGATGSCRVAEKEYEGLISNQLVLPTMK